MFWTEKARGHYALELVEDSLERKFKQCEVVSLDCAVFGLDTSDRLNQKTKKTSSPIFYSCRDCKI